MTYGLVFFLIGIAGLIIALAWNFVPGLKDRMRKWATVLEAVGVVSYSILGQLTGGIQDAVAAGYVPAAVVGWVPIVMLVWFLVKAVHDNHPAATAPK